MSAIRSAMGTKATGDDEDRLSQSSRPGQRPPAVRRYWPGKAPSWNDPSHVDEDRSSQRDPSAASISSHHHSTSHSSNSVHSDNSNKGVFSHGISIDASSAIIRESAQEFSRSQISAPVIVKRVSDDPRLLRLAQARSGGRRTEEGRDSRDEALAERRRIREPEIVRRRDEDGREGGMKGRGGEELDDDVNDRDVDKEEDEEKEKEEEEDEEDDENPLPPPPLPFESSNDDDSLNPPPPPSSPSSSKRTGPVLDRFERLKLEAAARRKAAAATAEQEERVKGSAIRGAVEGGAIGKEGKTERGGAEDKGREEEDEVERRRRLARERLRRQEEEQARLKAVDEEVDEEDEDESSSEYETDSDDDAVVLKPVFVPKSKRETVAEQLDYEEEERLAEEHDLKRREERRMMTKQRVKDSIAQEAAAEAAAQSALEVSYNDPYDIETDDDVDRDAAFAAWRERELRRMKRERTEVTAAEKEREERERLKNMTEEEREAWAKANPKEGGNGGGGNGGGGSGGDGDDQKAKKWKFMQKYWHRGAFFQEDADAIGGTAGKLEILDRDFSAATGEDLFDRAMMPKVMQVKNFGKAGRTKWTHLLNEDTTQASVLAEKKGGAGVSAPHHEGVSALGARRGGGGGGGGSDENRRGDGMHDSMYGRNRGNTEDMARKLQRKREEALSSKDAFVKPKRFKM